MAVLTVTSFRQFGSEALRGLARNGDQGHG
jgi:hypothetical protein